ncbi:vesicle transport protein GOT1B [Sarcoptes scabiei]|nr:vesicle transport protein GOT1B [Sarcoptes scabiei]
MECQLISENFNDNNYCYVIEAANLMINTDSLDLMISNESINKIVKVHFQFSNILKFEQIKENNNIENSNGLKKISLEWKKDISFCEWRYPIDFCIFDYLFQKIVTIRFKTNQDAIDCFKQINQNRIVLKRWNEYEISKLIGAAQWNHYRTIFNKNNHPWPNYLINMIFLRKSTSDDLDLEEKENLDLDRKERIDFELVIRIRRKSQQLLLEKKSKK